ncbi:MAG TPA: AI-2E family transporter [Gammaproteobacteria bacterium]|nr:AI-2E family transporter [Gammaproteobacteria bacterium]
MTEARSWFWLGMLLVSGWLIYLLAPVLTPFLVAALIAYLGSPLVERLQGARLSRTSAVVLVFVLFTLAVLILMLFLVPLLVKQIEAALVVQLPRTLDWLQGTALPFLGGLAGVETEALFDIEQLKESLTAHWREAGGLAARVLESVTRSGLALFGWLVNLVLIPVVAFYLLRDWQGLVGRIDQMLPRDWAPTIRQLAGESDTVLGAFLRGQLMVMLALGLIYTLGLWILGLELALLIGLLAGLVSFVPYLGFTIGVLAALLAGWFQFQEFMPLLWVVVVFGVGQLLESVVLTPKLVGDCIGLHPVAVIFAVMAGGQLFGFVGVLLALPVASVVMVLLRYAYRQYLDSDVYEGKE